MKKVFRKLLLFTLCAAMLIGMSTTVSASAYSRKRVACTSCRTINYSYGYKQSYTSLTGTRDAGAYCLGCDSTVPDGEHHSFIVSYDRYYFMCSRCGKVYTRDYINPTEYHKILNVD